MVTEPSTDPDAAIVRGVQEGDSLPFAVLFQRHVLAVRMVVRDNVRDPDDLADCVQEVFTRALENLYRLQDPARFRSWLLAIARHVAVDRRRRRTKDVERQADELAEDLPSSRRSPSIEIELQTLGTVVRSALGALPPREATAVALATYLELRPAEIAAALGTTLGNAKVIVHRARRHLRNALTLEMLSSGEGCPAFRDLGRSDVGALGQHVAECEACQSRARKLLDVDHA